MKNRLLLAGLAAAAVFLFVYPLTQVESTKETGAGFKRIATITMKDGTVVTTNGGCLNICGRIIKPDGDQYYWRVVRGARITYKLPS